MAEDYTRLLNAIDAEEQTAYGSDQDGDLAAERSQAIDMYLGRNTMPAPDGRSQVIDRSVYETIQWIKPSLARIFANGDDVVQLPPVGPEDEAGAKQESQYLNFIVLQKNNWFQIFDTAASDALLTKAAYLYPYVEKRRQVEVEEYKRQTPESLALIMQDQPEVVSQTEYPDPDYQPQPMVAQGPMGPQPVLDPATGQPVMQPPPMLYDIVIRRTKVEPSYCIQVLPPERCKISQNTKTIQVSTSCDYFEYYDFRSISDLRADGYDVPDDIGSDEKDDTPEDDSRNQYYETERGENKNDPSLRRVKCRYVWIRFDYDGDGIAELQFCVLVGTQVLYRAEVNRIPIAVLCPDPLPHRHIGLCPGDTVADIQSIKTDMLRQGLDNLRLANNGRTFAVPGMINLDDLLVSRPGGVVRGKQGAIFGQHIAPIPTQFMFPQAMEGLEYMDQIRENRTGTNRYFTGIDQNALNKTATGIQQLSTMAAQRVEQIARHFANGIEELFSLLHEIILKSGHKKDAIKLSGQWVEIDPSTWRSRTDFRISVGYAAGNKDAQVARLMGLASMQEKAMAGGLRIVTEENAYNTAIELTKASDFSTPERFWTDPKTLPPAQPPQPDPTVMAMEQLKAQSADNVKRMDVEQKERDSQRSTEIEKYKTDVDAQVKLAIANAQNEQAMVLEHQRSQTGMQMEHVRAQLNPKTKEAEAKASEVKQKGDVIQQFMESQAMQTQAIGAMFQQVLEAVKSMNGPKRIVRDSTGRASHVEPVQ